MSGKICVRWERLQLDALTMELLMWDNESNNKKAHSWDQWMLSKWGWNCRCETISLTTKRHIPETNGCYQSGDEIADVRQWVEQQKGSFLSPIDVIKVGMEFRMWDNELNNKKVHSWVQLMLSRWGWNCWWEAMSLTTKRHSPETNWCCQSGDGMWTWEEHISKMNFAF
jgi:hypothetical protein